MTSRPDTAVVVLNWNNAPDTMDCLESLARSNEPVDVIVVDNGSHDGSAELVEASRLAGRVLRTGQNLGYAGGNNAGIEAALDEGYGIVIVLNNDTVVGPEMIGSLLRAVSSRELLAVSPRILYADDPAEVWFGGGVVDRGWPRHLQARELPDPGSRLEAAGMTESECLSGCCLAATAETWRRVGLFDAGYFLIFEDSDWSARARRRGVRLAVAQQAVLHHKVSRSFRQGPSQLLGSYYYSRNGLRYEFRWQRRFALRFAAVHVLRPCLRALRHGTDRRSAAFALLGLGAALLGRTGSAGALTSELANRLAPTSAMKASAEEPAVPMERGG